MLRKEIAVFFTLLCTHVYDYKRTIYCNLIYSHKTYFLAASRWLNEWNLDEYVGRFYQILMGKLWQQDVSWLSVYVL